MNFLKNYKSRPVLWTLLGCNIILIIFLILFNIDGFWSYNCTLEPLKIFYFLILVFMFFVIVNVPLSMIIIFIINSIGLIRKRKQLSFNYQVDVISRKILLRWTIFECVILIIALITNKIDSVELFLSILKVMFYPFCVLAILITILEILVKFTFKYLDIFILSSLLSFIPIYLFFKSLAVGLGAYPSPLTAQSVVEIDSDIIGISFEISFIIGVEAVLFIAALKLIIRLIRKMIYKK